MSTSAKLIFFCGKMAAGKSTLARDLAVRENAVLLVQDDFLDALFPGEITDIPGFVKCASRLKNALTPHVCALLSKGISVVLDFPGNTKTQRSWFRELIERARGGEFLRFTLGEDRVTSYFGFRTVAVENGRFTLNGRPTYLKMVLDQGYWPESRDGGNQ